MLNPLNALRLMYGMHLLLDYRMKFGDRLYWVERTTLEFGLDCVYLEKHKAYCNRIISGEEETLKEIDIICIF